MTHASATAACMDALGSGGWQVAVETNRAAGSTLVLVAGDSVATCQTWMNAERSTFANTATGIGVHPIASPPVLSYLTGAGGHGDRASFLVGRTPPGASAVPVWLADGSAQEGVLGDGLWLAWFEQPSRAEPTTIEARDASGRVIARLEDADGLRPAGLDLHDGPA